MTDIISDWQTRWNTALREQHDILFDNETHSIKTQYAEYTFCPVCDSEQTTLLFKKDGFRYLKCKKCSMVYMNPRLNQVATYAFYNSNVNAIYNETKFDTVSTETTLDDNINLRNLDIIDRLRKGEKGKILEIGCAKGYFLLKAREKGYMPYGVELNEKNYQIARKSLGNTIYNSDLFDIHFESEMFDVIYMRDVIEHIHNPKPFFKELNRVAKSGSMLYIETHNIDALIHRIVHEKHTVIFGFEHPNHWSPKTLSYALKQNGFHVKKIYYESLDCTIWDILHYFKEPSFTTIYPWSISKNRKKILIILLFPFLFSSIRKLDCTFIPLIANKMRCGSVMKVIAQKID